MKLTAPGYYPRFRCIASACRHSCCAGWEIDIDEAALFRYRQVPGEFGKRLAAGIVREDGCACFRLTPEERCPFWNKDGLCDIILHLGEGGLCQICADHPRFRNFHSGRTELGLGLCCEAAGRLILGSQEKVSLLVLEDDGAEEKFSPEEQAFFRLRERAFDLLQNRAASLEARASRLLTLCGATLPSKTPAQWAEFYLGLERMDPAWNDALARLKTAAPSGFTLPGPGPWDVPLEQLLVYFVYRHFSGALEQNDLPARASFAVLSCRIIHCLWASQPYESGEFLLDDLVEIARLYSAEIEYSVENMEELLGLLEDAP